MALRIAPGNSHTSTTTNTQAHKLTSTSSTSQQSKGAPSAPGLPDTLRLSHEPSTSSATAHQQLTSTHPLESRLSQWTQTQQSLRSTLQRRTFGLAMPLRIAMEQKIVREADSFRPRTLGMPAGVHDDILSGRDATLEWEDVYAGQDGLRDVVDRGGDGEGVGAGWHGQMEGMVGMGKW